MNAIQTTTPESTEPIVGLGMPVYNGAQYIAEAIESIRAQTLTNFELIICDNASTDETETLCRALAAKDPRIKYHRNETNIGAHPNYNRTFALARGKYFKWVPHDDMLHPEFLASCVEALEADPGAVLCQTQLDYIDGKGNKLGVVKTQLRGTQAVRPATRFAAAVLLPHNCYEVMGVFRREALGNSMLLESFHGADRALVAQMALKGRFLNVPQPYLIVRDHDDRYTRKKTKPKERAVWHDTRLAGKRVFPTWRLYGTYWGMLAAAGIGMWEWMVASTRLFEWWFVNWNSARMGVDILAGFVPDVVVWAENVKQSLFSPAPGIDEVRKSAR